MALRTELPAGLSVFVVEDEALVALNLEDILIELGCNVVGPAMRIDRAEGMFDEALAADVAILDVNVAGTMIFPFARKLAERGMPLVFATGYGRAGLPEDFSARPILQKPYTTQDVRAGLAQAIEAEGSATA
ncbi:MAG: response regulator [Rhizobiaceae bacterium]|nr:response regulator [Rhizobiaceae bacterium]